MPSENREGVQAKDMKEMPLKGHHQRYVKLQKRKKMNKRNNTHQVIDKREWWGNVLL